MDTYVVHIYRRPDRDGGKLAGLVERVGDGRRKAFQSETQLLECLSMEDARRGEEQPRGKASKKRSQR